MSISELDLTIQEIKWSYSISKLQGIRASLIAKLRSNEISKGIYDGLNKDIRDRADWLKRR